MKTSNTTILVLLAVCAAQAQTWNLSNCGPIDYPKIDQTNGKFPPGSCPPPSSVQITCPNDSKIPIVVAKGTDHEGRSPGSAYPHPPQYAIDQYLVTRFSSILTRPDHWFSGDFGAKRPFRRILLIWEIARASDYDIQVSDDEASWTTVKQIRGSNGFIDTVDVEASGRYVRLWAVKRATEYGISIFDFTVCAENSAASAVSAAPKPSVQAVEMPIYDALGKTILEGGRQRYRGRFPTAPGGP